MKPLARRDYAPRIEMTPLIDVVFLLLTFFIYSLIIMVRIEMLPISLAEVGAQQLEAPGAALVLTIRGDGSYFLGDEPLPAADLADRLNELGAARSNGADGTVAAAPAIIITMEREGEVDRGPLLLRTLGLVRSAGLKPVLAGPEGE